MPGNLSQKEAFLYYLARMDTVMLDEILDDETPYFGVSKTVFLTKLDFMFYLEKKRGKKQILKIKQHRKHKEIFYLIFKNSRYATKFIMTDDGEKILSLQQAFSMKERDGIGDSLFLDLTFYSDEMTDFVPTADYLEKVEKCQQAVDEFFSPLPKFKTSKHISDWIYKYTDLHVQIYDDYLMKKFHEFKVLYYYIGFLFEYISHYPEAKRALETYDSSDPYYLSLWLGHYFKLNAFHLVGFGFDFKRVDHTKKIITYRRFHKTCYFIGDDFFTMLEFINLYAKYTDKIY
ncbi:MAG TPA: hypothetical protein PLK75_03080 [Bacteroidales bacterium]|nr:hypothetical protein [Bacteroidales bacterium]